VAGIVIFAFAGQAQLPQIFAELQAPPLKNPVPGLACETKEQRQTARLLRMQWLLVLQYAFVTALCCVLGLAGFLCFGEDAGAAASVLQPFRLDDALINAARLAMVLVAAVSYPVIHFTARAMLHDLTLPAAGAAVLAAGGVPPPLSTQRRYALTMLFFGGTLALALLATDLGTLFTIFGSLCGWAVMFGVPACLLLDRGGPYQRKQADRTHVADRSVEVWAYVAGWVVAVGGGLVCVSCLALEFT
jgi:amino acid permease